MQVRDRQAWDRAAEEGREDATAAVEIAAFPPGRIMGRFIASLVVWPSGNVTDRYARSSFDSLASVPLRPDVYASIVAMKTKT